MGGLADRELARRLKDAPRELTRELRSEMKKAAEPAAERARRAILGAESHHAGSLRADIAKTVSTSSSVRPGTGVQVVIKSDGTKMPPGEGNLPAYADGTRGRFKRWRHPTYGHDPWVQQSWASAHGWFDTSIRKELDRFAKAAEDACNAVARKLTGGG